MKLAKLIEIAGNKEKFVSVENYVDFCRSYIDFLDECSPTVITSMTEPNYKFIQYDGGFGHRITRPINSDLFLGPKLIERSSADFLRMLPDIRSIKDDHSARETFNKMVYTCQQTIGLALDATDGGNRSKKVNGDLFERFIQLLITRAGLSAASETENIPVMGTDVQMKFQHDIVLRSPKDDAVKAIGSVKITSKDRGDRVFFDSYLYNKLTGGDILHFAVYLHDVQRKGTSGSHRQRSNLRIGSTFLPGHFRAYTVFIAPLEGVYYCDLRPMMKTDEFLKQHIRGIDHLFVEDMWNFCR
ncbi:MAG: hypothetical protein IKE64_08000 [Thermoguttaceae bacterium]|nr:hypothetical protein [Thermoguttaceae bacterium]